MNQPPYWIATIVSKRTPAVLRVLGVRKSVEFMTITSFETSIATVLDRSRNPSQLVHRWGAGCGQYQLNPKKENEMNDHTKERNRKLAMLGGLGLGLAILGRKRRWRRYMAAQMMRGCYAGGPWGR